MGLVARNTAALLCGAALTVFGGFYDAHAQTVLLTQEEKPAEGAAAGQPAAEAPVDASSVTLLDRITMVSRIGETAIETMGSVSQVSGEQLERRQATSIANVLFGVPGIVVQTDAKRAATSVNIRGLQDFGRVAVIIDGARQDFQRTGHGTQSTFFIDPDLLQAVDVFRGPVANTYGSGAIGGVVVFETKDAENFLNRGETWAAATTARYETNGEGFTTSTTGAYRFNDSIDVLGNIVYRNYDDYEDGDGNTVPGTGFDMLSGLIKSTIRPTDNSRLRLGWIGSNDGWEEGLGASDLNVDSNTFTARYDIQDEDESWLDLHINATLNKTGMDQTYLRDVARFSSVTGLPIIVPKGSQTTYDVTTPAFDIWNTSRFDTGQVAHELTYGGDWVQDDVDTESPEGGSDIYTPSGKRRVSGLYIQDRFTWDWLEVIGGLRYDSYKLTSDVGEASGDRVSPRLTIGVSPFDSAALEGLQIYGTYAEGYRSPSLSETLISGLHPNGVVFPFLPNPDLKPETGTTWELGLNYKRDGIFDANDALRVKAAFFHNDIEDYIGGTNISRFEGNPDCPFVFPIPIPPICYQYQNFANAEIQGFEFEGTYDAGWGFLGLTASIIEGHTVSYAGEEEDLLTVPSSQVTGTLGYRFLENALTVGGEVQYNGAPKGAEYADDYTLVNVFANYQATENFRVDFRVDNLFNVQYVNPLNATTVTPVYEPGITVKLGATLRFGA